MLRDEAVFMNGVWAIVMDNICKIQEHLPEQILYVQPATTGRIVHLADMHPSVDDAVRLMMSVTDDLSNIHYICEIVGWDDKQHIGSSRLDWLNRVIYSFQWTESGVFMTRPDGKSYRNLLHVWRMKKLTTPFSVELLTKTSNDQPVSPERSSAGGWAYVNNPTDDWLSQYL